MMNWTAISGIVGGIGLFLLGMWLMTEGLKLSAGRALRSILSRGTRTIPLGIAAGALITAVVQSSSAVTVAAIGFVNAGLMSLGQAITVIYGANIGTTMTGWLVALVGFHANVAMFALPAIGLGMLARVFGADRRFGAIGQALAGFGLFFLGIDTLKTTFADLGGVFDLNAYAGDGMLSLLLFVGIGILLTTLMQSSSAAMALALTAAAGGAIPLGAAAALVIGTNIGTTSTALLAVIDATPNARRVAAAHVVFNLIAALVAIALLPLLLAGLNRLLPWFGPGAGMAILLALFHTLFNVLGVVLVAPMTYRLVRFLERRFRVAEEDEARPQFLDRNVIATPVLAIGALTRELSRIAGIVRRMAQGALSSEVAPGRRLAIDRSVLDRLVEAVGEYSKLLQHSHLPSELDHVLPNALRVSRYYTETAELSEAVARATSGTEPLPAFDIGQKIHEFKAEVVGLIDAADVEADRYSGALLTQRLDRVQEHYQMLKSDMLRAGTDGRVPVRQMVYTLDTLSNVRRIAEQVTKAARHLENLARASRERETSPADAAQNSTTERSSSDV